MRPDVEPDKKPPKRLTKYLEGKDLKELLDPDTEPEDSCWEAFTDDRA